MDKLLTITVPAYNVEAYLEKTLDSLALPFVAEALEVLVVDDGSTDGTAAIGRTYQEKYPQTFRLISQENKGHGGAINTGIREARGRYFKVLDGDDWVDGEGLKKLMLALRDTQADYIFTDYQEVYEGTGEKKPILIQGLTPFVITSFSALPGRLPAGMHALVLKTEILQKNGIRLDEHRYYVDVEYILYPIPYVETVQYLPISVYQYRLNRAAQSVSLEGFRKHRGDHTQVLYGGLDFLEGYKGDLRGMYLTPAAEGDAKAESAAEGTAAERPVIPKADKRKVQVIARRLAQMVRDQVNIYLTYPASDKEIRREFQDFDRTVREKSLSVYALSESYSGMLRLLRRSGFRLYRPIVGASHLRNRRVGDVEDS